MSGITNEDYETFFLKCMYLVEEINREFEIDVVPRQLDNMLLIT